MTTEEWSKKEDLWLPQKPKIYLDGEAQGEANDRFIFNINGLLYYINVTDDVEYTMSNIHNDLIKEKLYEEAFEELEPFFDDKEALHNAAVDLAERKWEERNG